MFHTSNKMTSADQIANGSPAKEIREVVGLADYNDDEREQADQIGEETRRNIGKHRNDQKRYIQEQQKKMIGMPQHLTYTPPSSPIQQVQQNIQTYGNRDRPNEGINTPGGGKGQSPTGGDVAGTPFVRGGRASYFDGGLASLWLR